ncbi:MAG: cellulase family glycosylhydrolase [Thermogemmatispora sp.]|uniref:glycoside hydrolase 5 family protein n=1 Tax=Thermogemmatispora sp. TaxID=1968838 RepID=UPI0026339868|nr:cellulase family glycosylhydrolase [Thermogemmatispora sp.]MBX5458708.1 cellulase family glycosylhydrolase [Thermogemmatispora sp.]
MQDAHAEIPRPQASRRAFLGALAAAGLSFWAAGTTGLGAGTAFARPSADAASSPRFTAASLRQQRNSFVSRRGPFFILDGQPFYFAGTNNYYMHYQSHFMIDDVLKDVAAMGLPVLRIWGFLDGQPHNGFVMQPSPGVYPEDGYERFDYTVWRAGQLGIKLVVPLVNNWDDFGGMDQYVAWFGASGHDDFYTNPQIKAAYKAYVRHFIHRVNRYTGKPLYLDPTLMTWELANEPRCQSDPSGQTLTAWVHEMSAFIKSMDGIHLVAVGDEGWYNESGNSDWAYNGSQGVDWKRLVALPTVDYGTLHLYPDYWGKDNAWSLQWIADHIRDGHALGKPVVLEEYGWLDLATRDDIYRQWTDQVYRLNGNGDQFWILTGLQDDGTLYPNYDGFRVTYPSSTATVIAQHEAQMRAKSERPGRGPRAGR